MPTLPVLSKRFSLAILTVVAASSFAVALDTIQTRHIKNFITIDAVGNAEMSTRMIQTTTEEYQRLKTQFPNPDNLARHLTRGSVKSVLQDMRGGFDDQENSAIVSGKRLAAAVLRRGRWEIQLDVPYNLLHEGGGNVVMLYNMFTPPNSLATDLLRIALPPDARDVRYDRDKRTLSYAIDRVAMKEGEARLECELEARRNLVSALYKLYAQPEISLGTYWVARTVLENDGDSDISDIRLRYRVGEYAPWSPESRYDLLIPGAALVDWYYPIFTADVAELANSQPVDMEMQLRYRDADGERREETFTQRTNILGRGQFETTPLKPEESLQWVDRYLHAPLLAAYATKTDPVVRELASLVSRSVGGGVMRETDKAVQYCTALYDFLKTNRMACDNPPGFLGEFGDAIMEIKLPRDVLRDHSGTSLDLALLFASACEAMGMPTGIGLIPGQCYFMVRFPNGQALPFDFTTLNSDGGGTIDDAYAAGQKVQARAGNDTVFIDIHGTQRQWTASPDLKPLPAGTLATWGYK